MRETHNNASQYRKYGFPIGIVKPGSGGAEARFYRAAAIFKNTTGVDKLVIRAVAGLPSYMTEQAIMSAGLEQAPNDSIANGFGIQRILPEVVWRVTPLDASNNYVDQVAGGKVHFFFHNGTMDNQPHASKTALVKFDTAGTGIGNSDLQIAGNVPGDNSPHRNQANGLLCAFGVTTFSDFGVGDGGSAALPIELLNFNAFIDGSDERRVSVQDGIFTQQHETAGC